MLGMRYGAFFVDGSLALRALMSSGGFPIVCENVLDIYYLAISYSNDETQIVCDGRIRLCFAVWAAFFSILDYLKRISCRWYFVNELQEKFVYILLFV